MSKKVLIIGAGSALAKVVISLLNERGYTVVTAGRTHGDVRIDLKTSFDIPADVDVVINCAATFESETDEAWLETEETNALGALRVCMAARKAGVRHVVHISSLSAVLPKSSPYYSAYAITKRNGDDLAEQYCMQFDVPLTILRPSQIYGDDAAFAAHQPFIYHILDRAERGEDITIYGEHDALRNYLHAEDLAEMIERTIDRNVTGTYACQYPSDVRFSEIAETAQAVFGKGGTTTFLKDKPPTPDNIFAKDADFYEKIAFRPQISLQDGFRGIQLYREEG